MREYDVYLPLTYNDGNPVEVHKITECKRRLLRQFGGLTHFPQENEGLWKLGGITFRDKIVILRVLADDPEGAREFFSVFRAHLLQELRQENVLIVEREVQLVE